MGPFISCFQLLTNVAVVMKFWTHFIVRDSAPTVSVGGALGKLTARQN